MSPNKDPARKRRIRSKAARLRRRSVPGAAADDRPVPTAETPPPATTPTPTDAPPPAAPVPTTAAGPPSAEPGGTTAPQPPSSPSGAAAGEPPSRAEPGRVAAGPPPLPVRGAAPVPASAGDATPDNPAVPPPFPPLSLLSAEELLADQPSVEMLRRVRRGLRALPESDRHLSD